MRPGTRQGEAAASLSFDGNRRATLLCSLDGRAGMLYAIAAPAPTFELRRPDLVRASGSQYAQEHASQRLGCQGYTRTGGGQRPDLARQLGSIYEQRGFIDVDLDVGEATFRCNNSPSNGYVFGGTLATTSQGMGIWSVQYLYGYRAEPQSEELARTVLQRIVSSFGLDPQWMTTQSHLTGDVSRIITETNAQISETISSGYRSRQATQDNIYRKWSNATLGQTDVRDPSTGEEFKVESGHNYYWRKRVLGDHRRGRRRPARRRLRPARAVLRRGGPACPSPSWSTSATAPSSTTTTCWP